jgi:hypothetical protein
VVQTRRPAAGKAGSGNGWFPSNIPPRGKDAAFRRKAPATGRLHGRSHMVINTNYSALTASRNLGESSALLNRSLARLSSGSKLVSPADDAAGFAVATRFDAQINRTQAANDNIGNAISFNQTQDGFLKKVAKSLDRMSELSILAQDVTKSDADRALYNQEFQNLGTFIDNTATKDFNGVSLFSGSDLAVTTDSDGNTTAVTGIDLGSASPPCRPTNFCCWRWAPHSAASCRASPDSPSAWSRCRSGPGGSIRRWR